MKNILFVSADSSKRLNFHKALTKFGGCRLKTTDCVEGIKEAIESEKFDCIFLESHVSNGKVKDVEENFVLLTNVLRQLKMLGHAIGDIIYIVDNDMNEVTKEVKMFPLAKKTIKRNDLWISPMVLNKIHPVKYKVIPKSYTG